MCTEAKGDVRARTTIDDKRIRQIKNTRVVALGLLDISRNELWVLVYLEKGFRQLIEDSYRAGNLPRGGFIIRYRLHPSVTDDSTLNTIL